MIGEGERDTGVVFSGDSEGGAGACGAGEDEGRVALSKGISSLVSSKGALGVGLGGEKMVGAGRARSWRSASAEGGVSRLQRST